MASNLASQYAMFNANSPSKKLVSSSQFNLGDTSYSALFAVNDELSRQIGRWNSGETAGRSSHIGRLWNSAQTRLDLFVGENGVLRYPFGDTTYNELRTYNTDIAEYSGNSADITNVDTTTTMLAINTTLPFAQNNPVWFYWMNTWTTLLNPTIRGYLKNKEPFDVFLLMNDIRKQVEITAMSYSLNAAKGYVDIVFNVVVMQHEETTRATSGLDTIIARETIGFQANAEQINTQESEDAEKQTSPSLDTVSAKNNVTPVTGGFEMNA